MQVSSFAVRFGNRASLICSITPGRFAITSSLRTRSTRIPSCAARHPSVPRRTPPDQDPRVRHHLLRRRGVQRDSRSPVRTGRSRAAAGSASPGFPRAAKRSTARSRPGSSPTAGVSMLRGSSLSGRASTAAWPRITHCAPPLVQFSPPPRSLWGRGGGRGAPAARDTACRCTPISSAPGFTRLDVRRGLILLHRPHAVAARALGQVQRAVGAPPPAPADAAPRAGGRWRCPG